MAGVDLSRPRGFRACGGVKNEGVQSKKRAFGTLSGQVQEPFRAARSDTKSFSRRLNPPFSGKGMKNTSQTAMSNQISGLAKTGITNDFNGIGWFSDQSIVNHRGPIEYRGIHINPSFLHPPATAPAQPLDSCQVNSLYPHSYGPAPSRNFSQITCDLKHLTQDQAILAVRQLINQIGPEAYKEMVLKGNPVAREAMTGSAMRIPDQVSTNVKLLNEEELEDVHSQVLKQLGRQVDTKAYLTGLDYEQLVEVNYAATHQLKKFDLLQLDSHPALEKTRMKYAGSLVEFREKNAEAKKEMKKDADAFFEKYGDYISLED